MMAWGPLLAGCLAGISLAVALLVLAGPVEPPAALSAGVRLSFLPVVAGLAFALPDPHRLLTGSLPARPWLLPVLRTALALPVVSAGSAVQLVVAGRAMAIDLRAAGQSPAPWRWQALTAELVAWSALALALTVILDRGRWQDVAGLCAAAGSWALAGLAAALPLHLIPAAAGSFTAAQQHQWARAWQSWLVVAAVGAALAWRGAGDPWRRLRIPARTGCPAAGQAARP